MSFVYWLRNQFLDNAFSTIFAVVVTWLYARQQVRRLRARLKALSAERQANEVVFAVSCGQSIEQAVRNQLPVGSADYSFFVVHRDKDLTPDMDDWMSFVREIREKAREINDIAATRIHLYARVPVAIGVLVGSVLDNGPEVVVYHYFNGTYRQVGVLSRETVYSTVA